MSVAKFNSKEQFGYVTFQADEKALEKVYVDETLLHFPAADLPEVAYKYDKFDKVKVNGKEAEVKARHRYSRISKAYWVNSDDKGGRVYVNEADIEA